MTHQNSGLLQSGCQLDYMMEGVSSMETKECTRCGRSEAPSIIGAALKFFVCDECRNDQTTEVITTADTQDKYEKN
jgi:hypothetical protein